MHPRAIEGIEVSGGGAELSLKHPQRGEIQLRGVAAAVWQQADGSRSVDELAKAVGAEPDAVWAALDALGDADLLVERVAAPEGLHEAVQREVIVVGDAPAQVDREQLEAQFDRAAEANAREIEVPGADERRAADEQAQAEASAAAQSDALAQLESLDAAAGDAVTTGTDEGATAAGDDAAQDKQSAD